MSDSRKIAVGGNPDFEHTLTHPEHGELVFRAKLPLAAKILEHQVAADERLGGAENPSFQTITLAHGMAALKDGMLITAYTSEEQTEDEETGRVHVEREFYDPDTEPNVGVIFEVWTAFTQWRMDQLAAYQEVKTAVGESEGQTPSLSSAGVSSEH